MLLLNLVTKKRCPQCGETLAIGCFAKNKSNHINAACWCRSCCADRYAANREVILEQHRKYQKDNREAVVERHRRYYQANIDNLRRKSRERARLHRKAHPGVMTERTNRWRAKNRDIVRERARKYRENNHDAVLESTRKWRATNPDKVQAYVRLRRARKASAIVVPITSANIADRMEALGCRCWYCGGAFEQVDHVIPLSKGGKHILANMRPSCASCNARKSNKDHHLWVGRHYAARKQKQ